MEFVSFLQGHRLGTVNEARHETAVSPSSPIERETPQPVFDEHLTDDERAKIRADRAAAAEARLKKQGGGPKKKKSSIDAPLSGPNSQPTLRWTAG